MHFVLEARHTRGIAIGIELIVQHEDHPERVFRVRKRLQMPCVLPEKVLPFPYLQF
jgi:hypothetical protein